jgi:hypothetical protein
MDDPAKAAGGKLGEYAYTGRVFSAAGERSAAEVLKDIVGNLQEIIRSEVRLARAEIREESGEMARAGAVLAAGALLGFYALFFLFLALVYMLTTVISPAASALVVGAALAAVAGVLVSKGRGRLKQVSAKPEKTIETVKENIEWLKGQTRS